MKKKRTAKQKAATKKLVAMNKKNALECQKLPLKL